MLNYYNRPSSQLNQSPIVTDSIANGKSPITIPSITSEYSSTSSSEMVGKTKVVNGIQYIRGTSTPLTGVQTVYNQDGTVFIGKFVGGVPSGIGAVYTSNPFTKIESGVYVNGYLDRAASLATPSGRIYQEIWKVQLVCRVVLFLKLLLRTCL